MTALTTGHKIVLGITTSFPGTFFYPVTVLSMVLQLQNMDYHLFLQLLLLPHHSPRL